MSTSVVHHSQASQQSGLTGESVYIYNKGCQSGPFTMLEAGKAIESMGYEDAFYWHPPMTDWRPATELIYESSESSFKLADNARILIVDDDLIVQEVVKLQLLTIFKNVETANHVREARQLLTLNGPEKYSCIISDYMMPGENGLDLVEWVKKIEPSLEVILLTARDDKETIKRALRLKIFDFLEKPVHTKTLIRTLTSGIQKTIANRQQSSVRYKMEHLVGTGGTGSVYQAWDCQLDRKVAFKRLHTEGAECPVEKHTLIEEALRLAKLQHPHIVSVFDCGTDAQGPFMVMELLEGETLDHMIETQKIFNPDSIRQLICQCLDALDYAHDKKFIHMDLKPSNIMNVRIHEHQMHIKLLDFGISRIMGSSNACLDTGEEFILGSPSYMAPERFSSDALDGRCDLYSLGCVLYHIISGVEPFSADSPADIAYRHAQNDIRPLHEICPHVKEGFSNWIHHLLRPSACERPESAAAAKESFLHLFS